MTGVLNSRSNHPVPHLDQSFILPKRTMRNKRFADRIAMLHTDFCRKSILEANWRKKQAA
jgi:hypothetical protein